MLNRLKKKREKEALTLKEECFRKEKRPADIDDIEHTEKKIKIENEEIGKFYDPMKQNDEKNDASSGNVPAKMTTISKARARTEKRPPNAVRYDGLEHKIQKSNSRQRCKQEGCQFKSYQTCKKCCVHLCAAAGRNCFEAFHKIKPNIEIIELE